MSSMTRCSRPTSTTHGQVRVTGARRYASCIHLVVYRASPLLPSLRKVPDAHRHPHVRRFQRTRLADCARHPQPREDAGLACIYREPHGARAVADRRPVVVEAQASLREASAVDAVIVGSGVQTREVVADATLMMQLRLDPSRQLVAAQCSGTLVLATLGLLDDVPACTHLSTKPWVEAAGVDVLNQPFVAKGNVATAGGCLASQCLAAWVIARLEGIEAAKSAMHYVAPVGEKDDYVARALRNITPFLGGVPATA